MYYDVVFQVAPGWGWAPLLPEARAPESKIVITGAINSISDYQYIAI